MIATNVTARVSEGLSTRARVRAGARVGDHTRGTNGRAEDPASLSHPRHHPNYHSRHHPLQLLINEF
jgi:hypothetical protein